MGGAYSYIARIVLPDSGPNSRNTVVSWTNVAASGNIVPLMLEGPAPGYRPA